ncbi:Sulfatase [Parafrankia sp. Ea1.12]|uniref:sulfatase-like hydrolase/transferase n=1 Tax=Parafrankia sp. Ea1.12 TaxID=573499 RepID=UPI000DA47BF6|nr:sulfatase-like hydrolase/transferase [Parafrankia sp. Ea1.12]SQD99415.1 Sulfatase [Parafrankia sp. Ea1.12]
MPGRHRRLGPRAKVGIAGMLGLATLGVTVLAGAGGGGGGTPSEIALAAAEGERPNFVFIPADDLDATTSPYWDAMPNTAALLRDNGLTFTESFAPTPICCPARGTLLTGKYGHNTGVLTNSGDQGGWATFEANGNEDKTFAKYLEDGGYRTALVGKYMNGIEDDPNHVPPGWTEWYGSVDNAFYTGYNYALNENGTIVQYGGNDDPANYSTDVVANKSVDFLERAAAEDEPFMLYAASTAPHLPLPPAPRHADNPFADDAAPQTPNFQEEDLSDKPAWLRTSANVRSAQVNLTNDRDYQDRMGSLYAFDEMVAGIVDTLRETGELDNTYLVFTSDNGYNLGSHRLINKMAPYEESLRVPLVVAGPGVVKGTDDHMVALHDIAPTFLELAGVPVPQDMDGMSIAPLLRGEEPQSWRTDLIGQYAGPGPLGVDGIAAEQVPGAEIEAPEFTGDPIAHYFDVPPWSGLRTERYTYVRWYDTDRTEVHERELYDLSTDPYQLTNLLATPAGHQQNAELVAELDTRLDELAVCSGASCRS